MVEPNIIFDDADFEVAVDQALNGGYFHAGQVCSAGSRILVHNDIKADFEKALIDRVGKIKLGNGFDDDTEMGPVISTEHRNKIEGYMEIAKKKALQSRSAVNVQNEKIYKLVCSLNQQ